MNIGVVLANSLWFIPTIVLAVILFIAARNGLKQYRISGQSNQMLACAIDTDCPPDHVCIKGRCIPESRLDELFSSMA